MTTRQRLKKFVYEYCPGFAGAFPYFGTQVYFPRGSHLFHEVCLQRVFEEENLKIIGELLRPGSVYFDVGANIGLMAVPILLKRPDCKVISFEPSPSVLPHLRRTAEKSNYGDRWTILAKAAGDHAGEENFVLSGEQNSAYDGLKHTARVPTAGVSKVEITTIDLEWERVGKPSVSVLKIDVEGAEMSVLEGATKCIKACRPSVLMEWNACNLRAYDCDPAKLYGFATDAGYRLLSLPSLTPIGGTAELLLHMLKTENFLLVLDEMTKPAS
jgi:FkbM family methyltransferase